MWKNGTVQFDVNCLSTVFVLSIYISSQLAMVVINFNDNTICLVNWKIR